MQMILKSGRCWLAALCLLAGTAHAGLPDPIDFSWAIERGDVRKVSEWLDEGLDPEFQGSHFGSGLANAAWHGDVAMMELFVARGANLRRVNNHGEQPLQLAAWNGHMEAVRWLLDHGAALNRDGNRWGALHYAVFNGHGEVARYLVERGAEVDARTPNGSTPLMLAAREGREDMAKLLLEAGADSRPRNDWGDTALTFAMRYDHYRVGKMISSPAEFAIAVKAPKEDHGVPARSASAPGEIEQLLRQIRAAEAEGQPSEELHARLRKAVNDIRGRALAERNARRTSLPPPYQPRSLVITARRGQPGAERAQIVAGGQPSNAAAAKADGRTSPDTRATQARIAELMRQIRRAEAEGGPAGDLRRQLDAAVDSLK